MPDPLIDRVRRVVSDVFGVPLERVTAETSRDDVKGWDSAGTIQLLMAIEAEFNVSLSVDEAIDLLSVPLVAAILRDKGAQ